MNTKIRSAAVLLLVIAAPLVAGANCSSNAVAQAAVTTFFNSLASNAASSLFGG